MSSFNNDISFYLLDTCSRMVLILYVCVSEKGASNNFIFSTMFFGVDLPVWDSWSVIVGIKSFALFSLCLCKLCWKYA